MGKVTEGQGWMHTGGNGRIRYVLLERSRNHLPIHNECITLDLAT